jgi:aminomethyltransferase
MSVFGSREGCNVTDLQATTVFLAVQGPGAVDVLDKVLGGAPKRFRNLQLEWDGGDVALAGTGYTGESGAEICVDPQLAEALVQAHLAAGAVPCGLGARDTLRLEAGLALWGEDIDETTTPLEARLEFAVAFDHEFIGRDRLIVQRDGGVGRRLAGLVLDERGIPRHGHAVETEAGGVGVVTSGNLSPMLERGVALAYISPPATVGETASVEIRGRPIPARVVEPPFHEKKH